MENQLHSAGGLAGRLRQKNARRRAGLPAKRFFRRYSGLSDVPEEELEILSQRLREALEVDPSSSVSALQALLRDEMRRRADTSQA